MTGPTASSTPGHRCCARSRRGALALATAAGLALGGAASANAQETGDQAAGRVAPDSVLVKLEAWTLGFEKAEVQAGEVTFRLENVGDAPHEFAIRADEKVLHKVDGLILPRTSKTVAVNLEPGSYTLLCPIEGHAANGMTAQLKVVE